MIASVRSAASLGIRAYPIQIEVDVSSGLPQLSVVGLPDTSVKESKERVRAAIKNSGYPFPPEKITINLAPADVKKEGPSFDLPIALGILCASEIITQEELEPYIFLGELALDGSLRDFKGAIVIAEYAANTAGNRGLVIPQNNASEACLGGKAAVYAVNHLKEVVAFLKGEHVLSPSKGAPKKALSARKGYSPDFSEIKGQAPAKRAVEIAASGGHNLLMVGSPGSGKTMLAQRIPTILPPLSFEEALEVTKIYSVAGALGDTERLVEIPPFRNPHHNVSSVAITGGGAWPKPGEISLAHGGVLFLDEIAEFHRDVLEALRAPLEDGMILVSRAKSQVSYPCRFMLAAAMNPCPCGYLQDPKRACRCSLGQIRKYRNKISGPILDRIDIHVEMPPLTYETIALEETAETSLDIRTRVLKARLIQKKRFNARPYALNSRMTHQELKKHASPGAKGQKLLEMAIKELRLSARAYYKILKIARTIADLEEKEAIEEPHIAEAIHYRLLDREW